MANGLVGRARREGVKRLIKLEAGLCTWKGCERLKVE